MLSAGARCPHCGKSLTVRSGKSPFKVVLLMGAVALAIAATYFTWHRYQAPTKAIVGTNQLSITQGSVQGTDSVSQFIMQINDFLGRKDCDGAIPWLRRLLLARTYDASSAALLGKCLVQANLGQEALQWLKKAKELGLNDPELDAWITKAEALQRDESELHRMESTHFELFVEGGRSFGAADTLLVALEEAYDQLSVAWGFYPEHKLPAVFFESKGFQGNEDLPDWTGALYDGRIRIPYNIMDGWPAKRKVVLHEMSHAFMRQLAGNHVPTWLDEGLAQHFDGTILGDSSLVGKEIPSVETLSGNFLSEVSAEQAYLLYQSSLAMTEVLLDRSKAMGGLGEIRNLLSSLSEGVPLSENLNSRFSITIEDLHAQGASKLGLQLPTNSEQPSNPPTTTP